MPPINFSRNNNIMHLKIGNKNQKPIDIKLKDEIIRNTNYPIQVIIKTVEDPDILGLEEVLELKRRYFTVKCTSTTGVLYKLDIKNFINVINKEEIPKALFLEFLNEKKKLIFSQIHRIILLKNKSLDLQLDHEFNRLEYKADKTQNEIILKNEIPQKLKILYEEVKCDYTFMESLKSKEEEEKNNRFISSAKFESYNKRRSLSSCFSKSNNLMFEFMNNGNNFLKKKILLPIIIGK